MSFSIQEVKLAAEGRWAEICRALAPRLGPAMERIGRHVPCPVHGGGDGFRLFKDFEKTGGGICNTCGAKTDGFALISWATGWNFSTTVNAVGTYLGLTDRNIPTPLQKPKKGMFRKYGRILEIASAPYKFAEGAQKSPYMRLREPGQSETESTVLWGRDLIRAASAAGVGKGSWVEVIRIGTQEVKTPSGPRRRGVWAVIRQERPDRAAQIRREEVASLAEADRRKADRIEEAWSKAEPLGRDENSAAALYLKRRKIYPPKAVLSCDALRVEAETPIYTDGVLEGRFATLTAAVRDVEGRLVTLHRTYLCPAGTKAEATNPKRLLALPSDRTILGAAVQLGSPRQVLAVAEGIETALSVVQAYRIPCWAAISAVGLEHFEPPARVRMLFIMADKDRSEVGQEAAKILKARMLERGVAAVVIEPEDDIPEGAKGLDWNDVLCTKGVEGFPRPV